MRLICAEKNNIAYRGGGGGLRSSIRIIDGRKGRLSSLRNQKEKKTVLIVGRCRESENEEASVD